MGNLLGIPMLKASHSQLSQIVATLRSLNLILGEAVGWVRSISPFNAQSGLVLTLKVGRFTPFAQTLVTAGILSLRLAN